MSNSTLPQDVILQVKNYLLTLQNNICQQLENLDGEGRFIHDPWTRPAGGGGLSRVMEGGKIFAKAGVHFSHVFGDKLPDSARNAHKTLSPAGFEALGISVIIHPDNPYVPTAHANVRFFMSKQETQEPVWWFGGGFDLTPYYGFVEDCVHWHQTAREACGEEYPRFKAWADNYFFLKHRNEARGIGGLFLMIIITMALSIALH